MNTANQVDAMVAEWLASGMAKDMIVWNTAKACVGWPYVFGAWGAYCSPSERHKRYNSKHPTIKSSCPGYDTRVCSGCKWYPDGERVRCFDCRGFTDWCLLRVGIDLIGEGATGQWTSNNWAEKGEIDVAGSIDGMPVNTLVCLFKHNPKTGKKEHTGFGYNGQTVECSNGVEYHSKMSTKWTHWAVPLGLYDVIPEPMPTTDKLPTLRKGNKNKYVKQLQTKLKELGYNLGVCGVDGDYGTATEAAVRAFQKDHGLTVDGVTGPKTWEKLLNADAKPVLYNVIIPNKTEPEADDIISKYPGSRKEMST